MTRHYLRALKAGQPADFAPFAKGHRQEITSFHVGRYAATDEPDVAAKIVSRWPDRYRYETDAPDETPDEPEAPTDAAATPEASHPTPRHRARARKEK